MIAMSHPQAPQPAKLIIGVILKDQPLLQPAAESLREAFGSIDMVSPWFAFDYTDYYTPEMGRPLYRRLLAFKTLIQQEALASIKCSTNDLEMHFAADGKRRINIDPGYLLLERFVLATGKNYTHRIYIGQGIYADLTLLFKKGEFHPLPWTYPDYAAAEIRDFLSRVRQKYAADRLIK
jgi:Domain of unknown function (DUF4416)